VEAHYLPDSDVCFSRAWTPFPKGEVWGVFPPHNCCQRGLGGAATIFVAPPRGGFGGSAPEATDERSYFMVFFPRRKPSFMRELYCGCVLL
jgi:hypothetical protein